jgi:hypothetical protein
LTTQAVENASKRGACNPFLPRQKFEDWNGRSGAPG